jgi:DinB superfamily
MLNPELEDLARQLDSANAEASAMFAKYSTDQLSKRPAGGGWSAADCVAHLAQTVQLYIPKIDDGMKAGSALRGDGPYSYGVIGKLLLWVLEPPVRLKVKAPPSFHPAANTTPEAALADYLARHAELLKRIEAANGLDLGKIKVCSPASDKMKVPLGAAFGMMAAHARRHLWQARRALGE